MTNRNNIQAKLKIQRIKDKLTRITIKKSCKLTDRLVKAKYYRLDNLLETIHKNKVKKIRRKYKINGFLHHKEIVSVKKITKVLMRSLFNKEIQLNLVI